MSDVFSKTPTVSAVDRVEHPRQSNAIVREQLAAGLADRGFVVLSLSGQRVHASDSIVRGHSGYDHLRARCQPHSAKSYGWVLADQTRPVTCERCLASLDAKPPANADDSASSVSPAATLDGEPTTAPVPDTKEDATTTTAQTVRAELDGEIRELRARFDAAKKTAKKIERERATADREETAAFKAIESIERKLDTDSKLTASETKRVERYKTAAAALDVARRRTFGSADTIDFLTREIDRLSTPDEYDSRLARAESKERSLSNLRRNEKENTMTSTAKKTSAKKNDVSAKIAAEVRERLDGNVAAAKLDDAVRFGVKVVKHATGLRATAAPPKLHKLDEKQAEKIRGLLSDLTGPSVEPEPVEKLDAPKSDAKSDEPVADVDALLAAADEKPEPVEKPEPKKPVAEKKTAAKKPSEKKTTEPNPKPVSKPKTSSRKKTAVAAK